MQKNGTRLIPPAYAGVSLLLAWTHLMFFANAAGVDEGTPASLASAAYSLDAVCMAATLLAVSFSKSMKSKWLVSMPVKMIAPIGLSAGSLLLMMGSSESGEAFVSPVVAGAILTGVFSGLMMQQWVLVYSKIDSKTAACSFPALTATSLGTSILLMYLPQPLMLAGMALLPIGSEAMFHAAYHRTAPSGYAKKTWGRITPFNLVLVFLSIVVYSLASGFLGFFSSYNPCTFAFYALVAFAPLLFTGAFIFSKNREGIIQELLIPSCFLVALLVPFFTLYTATPTACLVSIGELTTEVVLLLCTIGFAEAFSLNPFKTYAIGVASYSLLCLTGWHAAGAAALWLDDTGVFLASLSIVFVSIEVFSAVSVFAMAKIRFASIGSREENELSTFDETKSNEEDAFEDESKDRSGARECVANFDVATSKSSAQCNVGLSTKAPLPDQARSFETTCLDIGKKYGLSKREVDVLELLARGFSSARIQRELYIAAGTVNYHTRNIYAKLGIHSKQEAIDLVSNDARDESLCKGRMAS